MSEDPWYAERRARWKPDRVRLLLVAESAPDDGGVLAARRFFYDEQLTAKDSLFREVVRSLYDNPTLTSGPSAKTPWLERLRADGVFLIDLAAVPVNELRAADRASALTQNVVNTVGTARELNPEGVILVKRSVFEVLEAPMRGAGLNLLHDKFVPFPGSGQQKRFRERFSAALHYLSGAP